MIETLPLLTPDPERTRRTAARCRERLSRRSRRLVADGTRPDARYLAVERVLVGSLCVVYMAGVALLAIEVLIGR
jgi:hypothetical protein